jgi:CxxC-x17-CxxC domain-containing protein
MGNFRNDRRGGFGGRNRDRDSFRGNRGGFRNRDSGFGERRRPEMHDVICDKCGKDCQVPFKPTGDKPVLCSDCFRKDGGSSRSNSGNSSLGISQEQYNELNTKLDKILGILEMIDFEEESEEDEDLDETEEEKA